MKWLRRLGRRGQSTLEYLLIFAALATAIGLAATYIQGKVESSLNRAGDKIEDEVNNLMNTPLID